jgi:hypothetical protein
MSRDFELPPSTLPGDEIPSPVSIATGSELASLRGQVGRLISPGFEPPARIVFAIEPDRMPALASSLLLIEEIRPVLKAGCPRAPRLLGILWLGEACVVEIVGVPADEAFSPTWPMVLGGSSAVIDACASELTALRVSSEAVELAHFTAERLLGQPLNASSPAHIAELMRVAIETVTQNLE